MLASFYLTFRNRLDLFEVLNQGVISVLIPVIIVLSFLMVSTIPFDKIPPFDRESVRKHKSRLILFAVYFLIIIIFQEDRKSTRLNSSHVAISYAVFCL